jgi:hypothetical protein
MAAIGAPNYQLFTVSGRNGISSTFGRQEFFATSTAKLNKENVAGY